MCEHLKQNTANVSYINKIHDKLKRVSQVALHVDNDSYYTTANPPQQYATHFSKFVLFRRFFLDSFRTQIFLLLLLSFLLLLLCCHLKHPRLWLQHEKKHKTANDIVIKNADYNHYIR